jgi:hypothetical protein
LLYSAFIIQWVPVIEGIGIPILPPKAWLIRLGKYYQKARRHNTLVLYPDGIFTPILQDVFAIAAVA